MKDRASRAGPRDTPWHKMRPGIGIEMDSTALHELIAQVRGTAAELAEAERKVAAFKAELAERIERNSAPLCKEQYGPYRNERSY
jgi:hypothetical protein